MCIRVVQSPVRVEPQEGDRYRFWGKVDELQGVVVQFEGLSDLPDTFENVFKES